MQSAKGKAGFGLISPFLGVWDNITEDEVAELEGLFRHIYRKDTQANRVNVQRRFKKLTKKGVRINDLTKWN